MLSPATYDYPFRFENDTGPGTGGMGCFTAAEKKLPFLSDADLHHCETIMRRVLNWLTMEGCRFNGVLNGGFFKTAEGIRFMEFNARFGDPEGLNVLMVLDGSFAELLPRLWDGTLSENTVQFLPQASVVKYLVAPEYPDASPAPMEFQIDSEALRQAGLNLFFGACERIGEGLYRTLGSSRVLALGATAPTIAQRHPNGSTGRSTGTPAEISNTGRISAHRRMSARSCGAQQHWKDARRNGRLPDR